MLKKKIYFVAAVGTDIGKTFLVEKLCRDLVEATAIKPIASGFSDYDLNSDTAKIIIALDLKITPENFNEISPWRFTEASSPHFAAKSYGAEIDFLAVKNFCDKKIATAQQSGNYLFVESAGGIMTPINDQKTFLDLATELKIPLLLVTANYLGAISHTLSAVEAIKARGLEIEKIIINNDLPAISKTPYDITATIENFAKIPTVDLSEFFEKLA